MNEKAARLALKTAFKGVGDIINIRKSEHQCHVIMHPYHMTTRGTMQEISRKELVTRTNNKWAKVKSFF